MQQDLLPLFPLQVVLLPRTPLPLHIFEERYREMIGEALDTKSEFGIVQARANGILRVGCSASIERVLQRYEDGRLDVLTVGVRRFQINSVDTARSFLRGEVTFFEDDDARPSRSDARLRALAAHKRLADDDSPGADEEHPQLSFVLGGISDDLDFRQLLLTMRSEAERMEKVAAHLEELLLRRKTQAEARTAARLNGHSRGPLSSAS
jgi:Lon protease-like protein